MIDWKHIWKEHKQIIINIVFGVYCGFVGLDVEIMHSSRRRSNSANLIEESVVDE